MYCSLLLNFLFLNNFLLLMNSKGLDSVEHVIIFMQENRAFDHYFGTLKGVRGFNDRLSVVLPSGLDSFHQPIDQNDLEKYQIPWLLDGDDTSIMCMDAPAMSYETDIAIYNKGYFDSWNTARVPGTGMSYFNRDNLNYYYNLYDNFVVGDQYFQSTFTQTNPNRLFLFSGSNGLSANSYAVLDNEEPKPGFNWTTIGELLEINNISWKVYQTVDNFDDNGFAWFTNFQQSRPGDVLFDKGMARQKSLIEAFDEDMTNNNLPQVSWIIAPTDFSEHAAHHPAAGEAFTSQVLDKLKNHPDIYAKSVFILNYDEGGQFFDHSWTPTPPVTENDGISTCGVDGEVNTNIKTTIPAPMGLGFRVPLLIISPWTRGNIVVSEIYDHTSVIQFLEEKFNIYCSNISPWRRTITGNLLSAFDFEHPDYSWPNLPDTSNYVIDAHHNCDLPYPILPENQTFPIQEIGTRISKSLPYEFLTFDKININNNNQNNIELTINNIGNTGSPFQLNDLINPIVSTTIVKKYAIESKKSITDKLNINSNNMYHFNLLGPNGFIRQFMGNLNKQNCILISSSLNYDKENNNIEILLNNADSISHTIIIQDNAYNLWTPISYIIEPLSNNNILKFNIKSTGNWYDISVYMESMDINCYHRRYAGRMETGIDTISDPAMGNIKYNLKTHSNNHPSLPMKFRKLQKQLGASMNTAQHKDALWNYHNHTEF